MFSKVVQWKQYKIVVAVDDEKIFINRASVLEEPKISRSQA